MSAVMPVDLPMDDDAKAELARGAEKADRQYGTHQRTCLCCASWRAL